jgi:NitT/TauT family transport system permease protein
MAVDVAPQPTLSTSPRPAATRPHRAPTGRRLSHRQYLLAATGSFFVILVAWLAVTMTGAVQPMLLPSPIDVVQRLREQAVTGQLWEDMGVSTYRVMVAFLLAAVVAVPIGVLSGASHRVEAIVEPVVDFIRYLPVVAFLPLTIIWAGTGDTQKFLMIWLGTVFQQILMIASSTRTVPVDYVNLGATLGLSRRQILLRIVLPGAMPRIWDDLRVTLGWAWTWLVVAELVAATSGMGYRITQAQRYLDTELIFGYVFVLGIIGLIFDQIMRAIGRKVFAYERISR